MILLDAQPAQRDAPRPATAPAAQHRRSATSSAVQASGTHRAIPRGGAPRAARPHHP